MSSSVSIPVLNVVNKKRRSSVGQYTNTIMVFGKSFNNPLDSLSKNISFKKTLDASKVEIGRAAFFGGSSNKDQKKDVYLAHAMYVSYAMQGKSASESVLRYLNNSGPWPKGSIPFASDKVQNYLGGKFLRMYLEHKLDAEAVKSAGEEIKKSPEFLALSKELHDRLQKELNAEKKLEADFGKVATMLLMEKLRKGFAFRYELNTVIGGVTGLSVDGVRVNVSNETEEEMKLDYIVSIKISDTYDFDNVRHGEYDVYRKKLAVLLNSKKFDEFELAYLTEMLNIQGRKTNLDNAGIFASYMYALEKAKYTPPPLPWFVVVPSNGFVTFAKRANNKRHAVSGAVK